MNPTIRHEPMSEIFDKYHIQGLKVPVVIHHFKEPEHEDADPHDHPCDMDITILDGAYIEKRFPSGEIIHRDKGDSFTIKSTDIHLIIGMSIGGCTTLMLPKEKVREPGFWRFEGDKAYFRQWDWDEFKLVEKL